MRVRHVPQRDTLSRGDLSTKGVNLTRQLTVNHLLSTSGYVLRDPHISPLFSVMRGLVLIASGLFVFWIRTF